MENRIQLITDPKSAVPVEEQILRYIDDGGRWVLIYLPEAPEEEFRRIVEIVKPRCLETETFLLLADRVDLAKELNVGGVHLFTKDVSPSQARMTLGAGAVIGVTVHSMQDVIAVRYLDIDYVLATPFRSDDGDALGLEGLNALSGQMQTEEIPLPIVAYGGVTRADLPSILDAGASAVLINN